jgi:hypothetical protein
MFNIIIQMVILSKKKNKINGSRTKIKSSNKKKNLRSRKNILRGGQKTKLNLPPMPKVQEPSKNKFESPGVMNFPKSGKTRRGMFQVVRGFENPSLNKKRVRSAIRLFKQSEVAIPPRPPRFTSPPVNPYENMSSHNFPGKSKSGYMDMSRYQEEPIYAELPVPNL